MERLIVDLSVFIHPSSWKQSSKKFVGAELPEPPHIYVESDSGSKKAKYWLLTVERAKNYQFASHELTRIQSLVQRQRTELLEAWDDRFAT